MKKILLQIISICFVGMLICSCEKDKSEFIDITDYAWKLKYLTINGKEESSNQTYILEFRNDSLFMMDFSVNMAGGFYKTENKGHIVFYNYHAFTEMCCDSYFDEILSSTLMKTKNYTLEGNDLTFIGLYEKVIFERYK